MRKRVEYGTTTSQITPDGMRTSTTPISDPRGGYHIDTKINRHITLAQRLGLTRTRYKVVLNDPNAEPPKKNQFNPNKTVVWSRSRRYARDDGLITILHQRIASKHRNAA